MYQPNILKNMFNHYQKKQNPLVGKDKEKKANLFIMMLLFALLMPFSIFSQTNPVTVSVKDATLKQFFEAIEKQTPYTFSYRDIVVEGKADISIHAIQRPVTSILEEVLPPRGLQYSTSGRSILITRLIKKPRRQITGSVTDERGEPIIGANVVEKGTANGTMTDIEGKFSLQIDPDALLQISYIGYDTQDMPIGSKQDISIKMREDSKALDEVVVIGYGTVKRQDFTGSVSSIRLENSPIALTSNLNALESIKGNVAGLDIGATNSAGGQPSMQLRGQKSISGSNDPLIVVDGVIFMGSLSNINPNDIASYDILKDATSAAAYGSRSANGVIIITTKKGRVGKPMITFNASGSVQSWQNRPELMKGDQWLESVQARNNSTDLSWLTAQETANMEAGKETNWLDVATRTGSIQDYQLSVSGAGDRMNYYLSTAYSGDKGVVEGDTYDRITALAKITTDITSWLQIGIDASFTNADYSGAGANLYYATIMSPYGVLYRDEENKLLEKYPSTQSTWNPLWDVSSGTRYNMDRRNNFRTNTFALVKLPWLPGLSYRFNYSGDLSQNKSGNFYYESYYVKEGAYTDESRYSPSAYQKLLSSANGAVTTQSIYSWVIDNILNYKNTFGKHTIDLTAVATRDLKQYDETTNTGSDFSANGNTTLGINGLHKATVQKITLNNYKRTNIGYLGRVSYSFDDRYFFTGSIRRDGASVFGINQKWGNFTAVGLAWKPTSEKFIPDFDFLESLKIKLSWGKNGNQGLDPYGTLSTISNGSSGGTRYEFGNSTILYGLTTSALGNANLGWESTESWNTGFESSWFKNRLSLDVDLYFSKTTDQIFTRDIPVMTGFKTIKSSMGQVNNRGVEVTLRSANIESHDFNWSTGLTFWFNRNKLTHLYGDDLDGDGKEDDDISNSRFIGKPLGAIYGYIQDGIVQESDVDYIKANGVKAGVPKYKDKDGDGVITSSDRDILGYSSPNFKLNMSNTFNYKNWDLYIMMTGTFGGGGYYLKSNTAAYMTNGSGIASSNGIYIPWWTAENQSNKYPAATFAGDGGRFLGLQNRGFVRIQDITLSYTFREAWVKNLSINNFKVFATAKNLATFTNWIGGDPEVGVAVRDNTYPVLTTLSFGVNLSF
ncbi:TonB-dependent receptor [Parabacteroides sp. Marseille-P3160]|uniref:SusC/RagA family TonB-linked outer membrane protein n=2 Tax=Parabacteroides sp. Marseille-P3160 TaxID=1917887 RepID=UPI001F2DAD46|nr:TonB-dependent receptor [Parabacteroides sp. Marseille-P3160]